jgi:hypothetical protein
MPCHIPASLRAVLAGVVLALLSACGQMPTAPVSEEVGTSAAGYGRAFGRIVFTESGKERKWSSGAFAIDVLTLYVRTQSTGKLQKMEIQGDGSFLWPLQPGEYVIVAYQMVQYNATGRLWTTFSVPASGQAVYIGDLAIDTSGSGYRFHVEDNYDEALKKVEARLAKANLEPAKALMTLEPRLGNYEGVRGICAVQWGLKCGTSFQGVEPVSPGKPSGGYPTIGSVTPLLEWKPAPGFVHYDLVVYETIPLMTMGAASPSVRGPLVSYVEDLGEPRYQVAAALKPGTRYDWSVRLRDGNVVSSWSSTGYFVFFVVGWASGWGNWFGFTTPAK